MAGNSPVLLKNNRHGEAIQFSVGLSPPQATVVRYILHKPKR